VVTYPSEPILAIAAMRAIEEREWLPNVVSSLEELLVHGAVDKGYRGEVIVRLLNLLAMRAAQKAVAPSDNRANTHVLKEVKLCDYLKQFSRDEALIDDNFLNGLRKGATGPSVEELNKQLIKAGLLDSFLASALETSSDGTSTSAATEDGGNCLDCTMCFFSLCIPSKRITNQPRHVALRVSERCSVDS